MPASTTPIFVTRPNVRSSNTITASNTTKDMTSGTLNHLFASNTTNGSFIDHVRAKPLGTNIASVGRIFFNNGGATTNAVNNSLITEISLPATTLSEVAALVDMVVPLKLALPPAANMFVTIGTTVAAGWVFTSVGGDY